jgi:FkbM family methyltransferase
MLFNEWVQKILDDELKKKLNMDAIIKTIHGASLRGKVAFYPSSKYTRQIFKEIKKRNPALLEKVIGCFDKSSQATSEPGINVYHLNRMNDFISEISLLVIASSTYYSRQERDVIENTNYSGPILKTSYFDYSMPDSSPEVLLSEINRISEMLYDKKSKMIYIMSWLSRILNEEDITSLFESENEIPELRGDTINYKGYTIKGINDDELKKELFADVYKMKHAVLTKGDIVIDIGAFRGETAIVFADSVGKKGKVYAFEPIKTSYELMKQNVNNNGLMGIIETVNMGCSSITRATHAVSIDAGAPWNFISDDDGSVPVQLTTLDDFVFSNRIKKIDFIKMDVEGFENDVILGATKVLQTYRPKLAIALYHNSSDMITIPDLIAKIVDYRLFVRCNMDGPYGLTLFCV